jgi:periplasmic protein TonB
MSAIHETALWEGQRTRHVATSARRRPTTRVAVWSVSALAHGAALIVIASQFGAKPDNDAPPVVPPITIEVVTPAAPAPVSARAPEPSHQPATQQQIVQPRVHKIAPPVPHSPVANAEPQPAIGNSKATPVSMPAPDTASAQPAPGSAAQPFAAFAAPATPTPAPEPAVTPPIGNAAYLRNPPPHYPQAAQEEGWEGRVVLRVHVDASGHPVDVELHVSSGHDLLDQAALSAVRHWTFVPAKRGTVPVDGWVDVPLDFRLN